MEVRVSGGVVRGASEGELSVFRGIPFAAPPVGERRFGAPQAVQPWDGVRDATTYGPPPPQPAVFGMDAYAREGDDWLTVNVWSPDLTGGLPVMVWIQGGAYTLGTSELPEYDGTRLAQSGVVVVTFNYRVGLEGFTHIDGKPGNRGLLDQVAALEWVRDNISRFGGDPGRVTIFGQSAGGGSVAALLVMPRARGLFHRAIAQSVQGTYFTPELADDIAHALAAELGLKPTELSTVDPMLLPSVGDEVTGKILQWADRWGQAAYGSIPFAPVIDGDVLPTTPWEGIRGDVDLIVGHTRDELRLFNAMIGEITAEEANESADVFGPDPVKYKESFPDPEALHEVVRSDWLWRMPSLHLAEAQRKAGGRVFLYEVTWPSPGGIFGSCHGIDVPLVFGNLGVGQTAMIVGDGPEAHALSQQMREAWTNFAKHGDPGWPDYATGSTRIFDVEPVVTQYPETISQSIWRDHVIRALPLL